MQPWKPRLGRAALVAALLTIPAAGGCATGAVSSTIKAITDKPPYAHSTWALVVVDAATGELLLGDMSEQMFVPGSVLKVYSTGAALDALGGDHRFETPVYRRGAVVDGVLEGDLILVASGDFSFGLRERADGTMAFNSAPDVDHNYADTGLPGPALAPGSQPLAGVDDLAAQVRAAGIRRVLGDVIVDDRLFATYRGWPDGLVSPIWVNENVIDVVTTATAPGQPAGLDWRPRTAAYQVVSSVTTVAGQAGPLVIDSPSRGVIRVRGEISAGSPPVLNIWHVENPAAFARTAFIEALGHAGIVMSAATTGPNPSRLLPTGSAYAAKDLVAKRVSPPLAEYAKVILKTSYNRGADLMVCLLAVRAGSRDCLAGLTPELEIIRRLGVSRASTVLFDGAGSDERERTSPADLARFFRGIGGTPAGAILRRGLPVLGVDGDIGTTARDTPAAGKIQAKTGARAASSPSDQRIITALSLAGYAEAASGRQIVFAVFLRDLVFESFDDLFAARADLGAIAVAIQQAF